MKKPIDLSCPFAYQGYKLDVSITVYPPQDDGGRPFDFHIGSPVSLSKADQQSIFNYFRNEGFIDQSIECTDKRSR